MVFPSRNSFQKLTCENAAVINILLSRSVLQAFWLFSGLGFKLKDRHLRFPIHPICEVEGFPLLISVLCVYIGPHTLEFEGPMSLKMESICIANLENMTLSPFHAIVGLKSLLAKIDCSCGPMVNAMVDRDEEDILRKDINLKIVQPDSHEERLILTVFVHLPRFPFL